ncbi:MAG: glutamate 5-kinase, partial [Muribaculaceae bacterium]|nr:glutamate 5-kinase [Muribaculaceae bacterium]
TDADMLVILSNVDGIYTGNPSDPGSRLIEKVRPGEDVSGNVVASKSGFGRGGMGTKCGIASKVSEEGVKVIIAKGERRNVLVDLLEDPEKVPHTEFEPRKESLSTVKRWIAHSSSFAKGRLIVDENAEKVLRGDSAVSLLPIGVIEADGEWEEGDIVNIYGQSGDFIGVGRSSVSSDVAKELLGQRGGRPLVHYDYLYIE